MRASSAGRRNARACCWVPGESVCDMCCRRAGDDDRRDEQTAAQHAPPTSPTAVAQDFAALFERRFLEVLDAIDPLQVVGRDRAVDSVAIISKSWTSVHKVGWMSAENALLGLSEVAELVGASRQTVSNWRQRRQDFPRPDAELKSGPIWRREPIIAWARENGIPVASEAADAAGERGTRLASTVSLINMKGGVGKSTLTANLGWYCAYYKNLRVLLVDLDPQFNLSQYVLGNESYEEHVESKRGTVLDILEEGTPPDMSEPSIARDVSPENVIAHARRWSDGSLIDIIPSSLSLSLTLRNPTDKAQLLEKFLDPIRVDYDLILIDCAPTDSILTDAAYMASDSVLIPVKPEFLSTIGLPLVVTSLDRFARTHRKTVEVMGIVFNATTDSAEHDRSRGYVRRIAKEQGWHVFRNEVSYSDSYPKGSRLGKPIFMTDYARSWKISEFKDFAEEFYGRVTDDGA